MVVHVLSNAFIVWLSLYISAPFMDAAVNIFLSIIVHVNYTEVTAWLDKVLCIWGCTVGSSASRPFSIDL